ncbi:MAG: PEP-CTERM sorting domain-containing protein [Phycisphaerae bacterium]|jgi:hypothetical protein|nr:PEP-CTERM sorting domain-containing protein [Phycisphaerae bacterium]
MKTTLTILPVLTVCLLALGLLVLPASEASAQTWDEAIDGGGDAGDLLGSTQVTTGAGALTQITGVLVGPEDVDLYRISITSASTFSATSTGGFSHPPHRLYLFDALGNGISGYKDANNTGALLSDAFVVAPGVYHLALSGFSHPMTAGNLDLWDANGAADVELAPDGAGAAGLFDDWSPSIVPASLDSYTITLTGAEYAPEPATMTLLALGGLAVLRRRRRR